MNRMRGTDYSVTGSTLDHGEWRYVNLYFDFDPKEYRPKDIHHAIIKAIAKWFDVDPKAVVVNRMDVIEWTNMTGARQF